MKKLKKPVTLKQIKSDDRLKDMNLLRIGRLSVGQVKPEEWSIIMDMAK